MPAITLKSLPTSLHRSLKARAARHQRSLNQEAIAILQEAVRTSRPIDVEALLTETRRARQALQFTIQPAAIDRLKRAGRR